MYWSAWTELGNWAVMFMRVRGSLLDFGTIMTIWCLLVSICCWHQYYNGFNDIIPRYFCHVVLYWLWFRQTLTILYYICCIIKCQSWRVWSYFTNGSTLLYLIDYILNTTIYTQTDIVKYNSMIYYSSAKFQLIFHVNSLSDILIDI